MSQRTRSIIANVLLGAGLLAVVVFTVTHFMTFRPTWRRDMLWIGLACVMISRPVRGRLRGL